MNDNPFFKPTPLYKEFMILDLIEKNQDITQRGIGDAIGVAVSMVNAYLDEYEENGYIKREYKSTKTVEYLITKKGIERKEVLNIGFLKASQQVYNLAKENIVTFLNQIIERGFTNILLYGAGEVAEILLQTITLDKNNTINVVGVIDDDTEKLKSTIVGVNIYPFESILEIQHDGILISSYSNSEQMILKLSKIAYKNCKIIHFFQ